MYVLLRRSVVGGLGNSATISTVDEKCIRHEIDQVERSHQFFHIFIFQSINSLSTYFFCICALFIGFWCGVHYACVDQCIKLENSNAAVS